jgi:hypothetical protein
MIKRFRRKSNAVRATQWFPGVQIANVTEMLFWTSKLQWYFSRFADQLPSDFGADHWYEPEPAAYWGDEKDSADSSFRIIWPGTWLVWSGDQDPEKDRPKLFRDDAFREEYEP